MAWLKFGVLSREWALHKGGITGSYVATMSSALRHAVRQCTHSTNKRRRKGTSLSFRMQCAVWSPCLIGNFSSVAAFTSPSRRFDCIPWIQKKDTCLKLLIEICTACFYIEKNFEAVISLNKTNQFLFIMKAVCLL